MLPYRKTTVLDSSVGADAGQPSQVYTQMYNPIVPDTSKECNGDLESLKDFRLLHS